MIQNHQRIIGDAARRAALVFAAEGWTWGQDLHVPTEGEIALVLRGLANDMERDPELTSKATGRLAAYSSEDGYTLCLELARIARWRTDGRVV